MRPAMLRCDNNFNDQSHFYKKNANNAILFSPEPCTLTKFIYKHSCLAEFFFISIVFFFLFLLMNLILTVFQYFLSNQKHFHCLMFEKNFVIHITNITSFTLEQTLNGFFYIFVYCLDTILVLFFTIFDFVFRNNSMTFLFSLFLSLRNTCQVS